MSFETETECGAVLSTRARMLNWMARVGHSINAGGADDGHLELEQGPPSLKTTELPAAAPLDGTELVPVVQAGVTDHATTQQIANLGAGATNYWTYDGSTLQPDPATTTPLENLPLVTTDGSSTGRLNLTPTDSTLNVGNGTQGSVLDQTITGSSADFHGEAFDSGGIAEIRAIADSGVYQGTVHAVTGANDAGLLVDGTSGLFSLTADDGTYNYSVNTTGGQSILSSGDAGDDNAIVIAGTRSTNGGQVVLATHSTAYTGSLTIDVDPGVFLLTSTNHLDDGTKTAEQILTINDNTGAVSASLSADDGANPSTLAIVPKGLTTTPIDSHTATVAFGSLTIGTPKQNTLGYDIVVTISVPVTAATAGSLKLGVGSSATPTTDTVTPSLTGAVSSLALSAYVPNNYYLSVASAGTITLGSPVLVATPV